MCRHNQRMVRGTLIRRILLPRLQRFEEERRISLREGFNMLLERQAAHAEAWVEAQLNYDTAQHPGGKLTTVSDIFKLLLGQKRKKKKVPISSLPWLCLCSAHVLLRTS